jgi:hypothetical protein
MLLLTGSFLVFLIGLSWVGGWTSH